MMKISGPFAIGLAGALLANAIAAAASLAVEPPQWTKTGAALAAETNIAGGGGVSRIYETETSEMIVCSKTKITGKIKNEASEGKGSAVITFEECKYGAAEQNATTKQRYMYEPREKCTVYDSVKKEPGKIEITLLKSFLAFVAGHAPGETAPVEVLDVFVPETGTKLVKLEFVKKGTETCIQTGTSELFGGMVAKVPRFSETAGKEEATQGDLLFEAINSMEVAMNSWATVPRYTKYQLKKGGTVTEVTLKIGTPTLMLRSALESTDTIELPLNGAAPVGPEPFAASF